MVTLSFRPVWPKMCFKVEKKYRSADAETDADSKGTLCSVFKIHFCITCCFKFELRHYFPNN